MGVVWVIFDLFILTPLYGTIILAVIVLLAVAYTGEWASLTADNSWLFRALIPEFITLLVFALGFGFRGLLQHD